MNGNASEKTPQTGTYAGGQLYGQVDQHAYQQQWQSQVHQQPQCGLPGQTRFGQSVAHDSLYWRAFEECAPHASMLTKAGKVA